MRGVQGTFRLTFRVPHRCVHTNHGWLGCPGERSSKERSPSRGTTSPASFPAIELSGAAAESLTHASARPTPRRRPPCARTRDSHTHRDHSAGGSGVVCLSRRHTSAIELSGASSDSRSVVSRDERRVTTSCRYRSVSERSFYRIVTKIRRYDTSIAVLAPLLAVSSALTTGCRGRSAVYGICIIRHPHHLH